MTHKLFPLSLMDLQKNFLLLATKPIALCSVRINYRFFFINLQQVAIAIFTLMSEIWKISSHDKFACRHLNWLPASLKYDISLRKKLQKQKIIKKKNIEKNNTLSTTSMWTNTNFECVFFSLHIWPETMNATTTTKYNKFKLIV